MVRGLIRREAALDIVRAQDAGLSSVDDLALLAQAAAQNRILIAHDASTLIAEWPAANTYPACLRCAAPFPFRLSLRRSCSCSNQGEWEGQVRYYISAEPASKAIAAPQKPGGRRKHRTPALLYDKNVEFPT